MSSSYYTRLGLVLKKLLDIMDIPDEVHTVSVEFTLKRDKEFWNCTSAEVWCLPAEQKSGNIVKIPPKDVD